MLLYMKLLALYNASNYSDMLLHLSSISHTKYCCKCACKSLWARL